MKGTLTCLCCLSQELKSPVQPGSRRTQRPWIAKCCMNHFKGSLCPSPPRGTIAPAPLFFLDSGYVLQPRCLLSLRTPKCFISPAQPALGKARHALGHASLL